MDKIEALGAGGSGAPDVGAMKEQMEAAQKTQMQQAQQQVQAQAQQAQSAAQQQDKAQISKEAMGE